MEIMMIIVAFVIITGFLTLIALSEKVDKNSAKINEKIKVRQIKVSEEIRQEIAEYEKKDEKV